ncbi:energy-coupling factor transporter ATP-binding protein EcfA2 [Streptacidiphilus sp. BW17]
MTERRTRAWKKRGKQMPENPDNEAIQETHVQAGDVSGTMIVGHDNTVNTLEITARRGSKIIVHPGPRPAPAKRHPIAQLPRSVADPLIGREHDVRIMQAAVETRQLVQLWGVSGVGKSALLRHLSRTLPRGPEGVAYIEAGGRTADDLAQAIFDVSFDIGFDTLNYKPSLEVLKEHLQTLKLRIYLDDAGLDEKDLRRLFDMAEQSTFVFTSQQPTVLSDVHPVQLDGLTDSAAAELVNTLLDRELGRDETRIVKALCDAVRGNPLELRRIAMSAAIGNGLPSITALPQLLPALVKQLRLEERDLLHLLGSIEGAELAARHLNDLLGRTDADTLAAGLVRHGLLLTSETGYSCPPDVAECVLATRKSEFPADQLCRTLTAWVDDQATTPDDVAAHFQALDIAVLRAERLGQADLGVSLARAASPKLALSRQFDAWGSLLGAGWAVAKHVGDKQGEEFFLREARTRRKSITRVALTTALVVEAEVLWKELAALHAKTAAAQNLSNAATALTPPPVHLLPTPPSPAPTVPTVHPPVTPATTPPAAPPATPPPAHVAPPVHVTPPVQVTPSVPTSPGPGVSNVSSNVASKTASQSQAGGSHMTGTQASTHATASSHLGTTVVGKPVVVAGVAGKGGIAGLAFACTLGLAAVVGVGVTVYADNQPVSAPVVSTVPTDTTNPTDTTTPTDDTSPSVDPACTAIASTWSSEVNQYNFDYTTATSALDAYNSAMASYNAGQTSTPPDDSTLLSDVQSEINDLQTMASTVQEAQGQAQSSSVQTDLDDILTPDQQLVQMYQAYENDPQNNAFDGSSQVSSLNSAAQSLQTDCGG